MRIWRYELDQEAKDLHPLKTLKVDAHLFYTLWKNKKLINIILWSLLYVNLFTYLPQKIFISTTSQPD